MWRVGPVLDSAGRSLFFFSLLVLGFLPFGQSRIDHAWLVLPTRSSCLTAADERARSVSGLLYMRRGRRRVVGAEREKGLHTETLLRRL